MDLDLDLATLEESLAIVGCLDTLECLDTQATLTLELVIPHPTQQVNT